MDVEDENLGGEFKKRMHRLMRDAGDPNVDTHIVDKLSRRLCWLARYTSERRHGALTPISLITSTRVEESRVARRTAHEVDRKSVFPWCRLP
ncbi:hypothetical protein ABZ721_23730 [Streptomyces sp. NPDC006733]|uniref:hypothetical protein n=1 Tax=Streptomyces sp. NPDC006733 TaxID=3155460 RepID=UPI0033C1F0A0